MSLFQDARFVASVAELSGLPGESVAEVAFAGRSNSGKSSALNALLNRNRLAFVSKTPGRTQHLNYFDLGDHRYLVDLPGYGYARLAKTEQDRWSHILPSYLRGRSTLCGVVLIMDVRHPLTPLDTLLLRILAPTRTPLHVLLTKADKLSRAAAQAALRTLQSELIHRLPGATSQLFSSLSRDGVAQARETVEGWLRPLDPRMAAERIKKPPVKGE